ncbi:G1/S-specific cyclin-E1-like [Zophobas morio]|uniref:G1/S-specific cyclin-E1-like n=1 Tax=Zophobas morio TaxID=2755281 RepID=UPI0030832F00
MSCECNVDTSVLQLYGTSALSLACKFQELKPLPPSKLAGLTLGACTTEAVIKLECVMLNMLSWNLITPTSASWVIACLKSNIGESFALLDNEQYLKEKFELNPRQLSDYNKAMELITFGIMSIEYNRFPASIVAYSALDLTRSRTKTKGLNPSHWYSKEIFESCKVWLKQFMPLIRKRHFIKNEDLIHRHPENLLSSFKSLKCK